MAVISQVVKNALFSGYLTVEAEAALSQQFDSGWSLEDITALTLLQRAVISGRVKRLSQDCAHIRSTDPCLLQNGEQDSTIGELQIIP